LVTDRIPLGFKSPSEFETFGGQLNTGLKAAGYEDAQAAFQGSSVTGKSFKTGEPFDAGRTSDYDIAVISPKALARAKDAGTPLRSSGTRTGPLGPRDMARLGLRGLAKQLGKTADRPVKFMIFDSLGAAAKKGPTVPVP
jgi:filamentous hemagglutinin